ncbi:MAG: hypothetical protein MRQ09_03635 [Candidatus Midichloria sp.]|nr:hypothetical protein [Candidatus Midichloria sp.]
MRRIKKTKVFIEDSYKYVSKAFATKNRYDLVIVDLFYEDYIPNKFLTSGFMKLLKGITYPGGVVAINTFASSRTYEKELYLVFKFFGNFYNLVDQNRIMLAYNGGCPT